MAVLFIEVDIDETLLSMNRTRTAPIIIDHIVPREAPLRVEVLKGSIDVSAECLRNTDAVIAIEIIEHLYPDVLENVPYNIFGFIQPKLAIFSTPNSDFNVLFIPLSNGFRHIDHKFEWSQEQFKDWALNICDRFPNYRVCLFGVGESPPDVLDMGPVSQFALFVRKDVLHMPLETEIEHIPADETPENQYKEIYSVDYPLRHDDRSPDQKILDEAKFYINQYRTFELYHNPERLIYQIPFEKILEAVAEVTTSADDLKRVLLENQFVIEDNFVVLPEDDPDRLERPWSDCDTDSFLDHDVYGEDIDDDHLNSSNDRNRSHHEDGDGNDVNEEEEEEECWD